MAFIWPTYIPILRWAQDTCVHTSQDQSTNKKLVLYVLEKMPIILQTTVIIIILLIFYIKLSMFM